MFLAMPGGCDHRRWRALRPFRRLGEVGVMCTWCHVHTLLTVVFGDDTECALTLGVWISHRSRVQDKRVSYENVSPAQQT